MSGISRKQNQEHQLDKLRAFSQLYLEAKRVLALNILLSIITALIGSIVPLAYPSLDKYTGFLGAMVAAISAVILIPNQKETQRNAAKIQQLFDCELFEMSWTEFNIEGGSMHELIIPASNRFRKHPSFDALDKKLRDWYPKEVEKIPLELERLVCQRMNCWWDSELRKKYSNLIIYTVLALSALVLGLSLIGDFALAKFLLVFVAPLSPTWILGFEQYRDNLQAVSKLDRLREDAERIWCKALNGQETSEEIYRQSIKLQDAIFDSRASSPLIFNWFYQLFRDENQTSMSKIAEVLVKEANDKLGSFN